jgi:hypothetical protein
MRVERPAGTRDTLLSMQRKLHRLSGPIADHPRTRLPAPHRPPSRRPSPTAAATARVLLPPPAPQIARRRKAHQDSHPDAKLISLGIGDTTEPIPPFIADAMQAASQGLGTLEGYSGCACMHAYNWGWAHVHAACA